MITNPRVQQLETQLKAHYTEVQDLLAKPNFGENADDVKTVERIRVEGEKVQSTLKAMRDAAALKGALAQDLKSLNDPINAIPHFSTPNKDVTILGHYKDGDIVYDPLTGQSEYKFNPIFTGADQEIKSAWPKIITNEYHEQWRDYITGNVKTLAEGIDPQGGFWTPPQMLPGVIQRKPTPTRLFGRASQITASSDRIEIASVPYRGNSSDDPLAYIYPTGVRATLVPEIVTTTANTTAAAQAVSQVNDSNIIGKKSMTVFTWLLNARLTRNQIEDAGYDPAGFMQRIFGQTIELLKDNMILNGTGASMPRGVFAATGTDNFTQIPTIASAVGGTIGYNDVVNMFTDVPEQYDDACIWGMTKNSGYRSLAKILDSQNRPLFGTGYQDSGMAGKPTRILEGYPIVWSQFFQPVQATSKPLVFGDFGGVTVADRIGLSIQMQWELYSNQNLVGMLGRVRFGVEVMEPWRLRVLTT
jgi:HK97 family phage major capsid protein